VLRKYPNAKFVVVGGGSYAIDDSVFLKSLVYSSNLAESVIFTGRVEHPAEFIVDADVCVAPSPLYFSPIKVYEYLACKKPVILDKNADIADLLVTKKAALLTDTTNPSELALTVIKSLQDRDSSREIASNGYEVVTNSYTWKKIAEKLTKLMKAELKVKRKFS
jgi:glycosyltransferase involved in cell wall biosynthesis